MERFLKIDEICWQTVCKWAESMGFKLRSPSAVLFSFLVLFCFWDRIASASRALGLMVCPTTPGFFHLFYYTCLLHRSKKSSQRELYWPQNFVVIQTKTESKGPHLLRVSICLSWTVYKVLAPANTQTAIILFSRITKTSNIHPLHCFWCLNLTSCDNQWTTEIL